MEISRRSFGLGIVGAAVVSALPGCATSSKESKAMAIDTHAHIFERGLSLANVRRYTTNYDAKLEDYLRVLDANGMTHGVLVQPSFLGTDNSYMLAALRAEPRRLRGVAVVDPTIPVAELIEMAKAGVVGVRLNLVGKPIPDVTKGPWPQFLAHLIKLDWHVEIHREAKDLPKIVQPLIDSGVKVVVDHFGRPDHKLGVNDPGFRYLLSTAKTGRVWVKISGAYRNGANGAGEATALAAIPLLKASFGLDRLVWGSDWPHTQFEKTINYPLVRAQLDTWLPDPAERKIVLGYTPAKLFHFK